MCSRTAIRLDNRSTSCGDGVRALRETRRPSFTIVKLFFICTPTVEVSWLQQSLRRVGSIMHPTNACLAIHSYQQMVERIAREKFASHHLCEIRVPRCIFRFHALRGHASSVPMAKQITQAVSRTEQTTSASPAGGPKVGRLSRLCRRN
jgi:hypothetical protein